MFRVTSTLSKNLYRRAVTQPMLFTSPVENNKFTLKISERSSSSNELSSNEKHEIERVEHFLKKKKSPPPSFNSSKVQNKIIEKFVRQWHEEVTKEDDYDYGYPTTLLIIKIKQSDREVYERRVCEVLQDISSELGIDHRNCLDNEIVSLSEMMRRDIKASIHGCSKHAVIDLTQKPECVDFSVAILHNKYHNILVTISKTGYKSPEIFGLPSLSVFFDVFSLEFSFNNIKNSVNMAPQ